ncbi:NAD-dependent epimerase/dehydratase family protein [Streptomyces mobaraensis]|uniref:NAD-dependent epimerase/dehydratase n=1 Tax=Streptomyces mobaraensis TaxID=35621 RepID=A0A5N5W4R3_STRMB|nr:NAD(P)-dependent oxidoreductase [Streptomyces mobaraensis]KAB7839960.1 NAD-dependent epimerase/dehydratase [Streptomyces mobaraensis]
MRILVLGATGFLGRHTAERLRALPGARVLDGGRSPGAALPCDLAGADPADLAVALRGAAPDTVVNCAGVTGGAATALTAVNARGPAVLCEALRLAAPAARLVHLGSAAEYGAGDGARSLTESAPTAPLGLYGAAKLAGTLAVTGSGLDALVLRVFNPLGPGSPPTSLPGRLAEGIREAGPDGVVRTGDLSAHRDFVDARDVARAVVLAVTAPEPVTGVLNIGSGTAHTAREVAEGLARAAGFRGRVDEGGDGSPRSAALPWQQADITAAGRALGWRPEYAFDDTLADLWAEARLRPVRAAR